ncbi:hypothetical protein HYV87_04840 [Candidatus Woesearchaeota archaeon]|nr:hypothetical protein [Candidatus Woesearchaeota archaeon]MBI2582422.1 hypothetical protein [Candidatus Woesearchaeota archaeon]
MKAYITKKDISVAQGYETVFQGTIYVPEGNIEICKRNNRIQPFDAYIFRLVQGEQGNLEEFDIDEQRIRDLLSKGENLDKAKKDLEATLKDLYQSIT